MVPTANHPDWFIRLTPVSDDDDDSLTKCFALGELLVDSQTQKGVNLLRGPSPGAIGPQVPRRYEKLVEGGVLLGRKSSSLRVSPQSGGLSSPIVSRNHAQLMITPHGHVYVVDLSSLHGTSIESSRVRFGPTTINVPKYAPVQLCNDDVLVIGKRVQSESRDYHPLKFKVEFRYSTFGRGSHDGTRMRLLTLHPVEARDKFATASDFTRLDTSVAAAHREEAGSVDEPVASPVVSNHKTSPPILCDPVSLGAGSESADQPESGAEMVNEAQQSPTSISDDVEDGGKRSHGYGVPASVLYQSAEEDDLPRGSPSVSRGAGSDADSDTQSEAQSDASGNPRDFSDAEMSAFKIKGERLEDGDHWKCFIREGASRVGAPNVGVPAPITVNPVRSMDNLLNPRPDSFILEERKPTEQELEVSGRNSQPSGFFRHCRPDLRSSRHSSPDRLDGIAPPRNLSPEDEGGSPGHLGSDNGEDHDHDGEAKLALPSSPRGSEGGVHDVDDYDYNEDEEDQYSDEEEHHYSDENEHYDEEDDDPPSEYSMGHDGATTHHARLDAYNGSHEDAHDILYDEMIANKPDQGDGDLFDIPDLEIPDYGAWYSYSSDADDEQGDRASTSGEMYDNNLAMLPLTGFTVFCPPGYRVEDVPTSGQAVDESGLALGERVEETAANPSEMDQVEAVNEDNRANEAAWLPSGAGDSDLARPRTPSFSASEMSSDGPVTPLTSSTSLKRARTDDDDDVVIHDEDAPSPSKARKVASLPPPKRGIASSIGLVVLGAALGSVGTIAGLMQLAD